MKLGKLFSGLFKRKTADKIEAAARMIGRNDIAAGVQGVEDIVDKVKGRKK
jgi:hypothetical protein